MRSLFAKLKHRTVFKAGVVYAILAWLALNPLGTPAANAGNDGATDDPPSQSQSPGEAETEAQMAAARELFDSHRYADSDRVMEGLERANPDNEIIAATRYARIFFATGDNRPFFEWTASRPKLTNASVVSFYADMLMMAGRYQELVDFTRAYAFESGQDRAALDGGFAYSRVLALHLLGRQAEAAESLDEAEASADAALSEDSEDASALSAKSYLALAMGLPEDAQAFARKSVAVLGPDDDPELVGVMRLNLAEILTATGSTDEALALLDDYLSSPDADSLAYLMHFAFIKPLQDNPGFPALAEKHGWTFPDQSQPVPSNE